MLFDRYSALVVNDEPVDNDFDRVLLVLGQIDCLVEIAHFAIDPDAHETLSADLVEHVLMFAFAILDRRSEHHEPSAVRQAEYLRRHLLYRLASDRATAVRAMWVTDAGVEQAEIV